jgi:hypothetical protein
MRCGDAAMSNNPSIEYGVFGPEATAAMGEAFDATCKELGEIGQFEGVRELVAARIIMAARGGELDPVLLRMAALSGLSFGENSSDTAIISYMQLRGAVRH